jgi:AGCS family alanine or glycine:cation symporter
MPELLAFASATVDFLNTYLWHEVVLLTLVGTGLLFTVWSRFLQWTALTHGVAVTRGLYDDAKDPGAINHFQALSTALSGTVGLGAIGGVALAIALGGPGAVFWMWVVGLLGMAVKSTEVTLSMLYRVETDRGNPHGGPMFVVSKGFAARGMPKLGYAMGWLFCLSLLVATLLGASMFQSWNVGAITEEYFGVPGIATGAVLAVLCGLTIIGGIKRIGRVTALLTPLMCLTYLVGSIYVLIVNAEVIPAMFGEIFRGAFAPTEAAGAFIGGSAGYAFLMGMKRAIYSNEVGQGSSPMAHSAAKTDEPVREGVVAGLEPFIDTMLVCTMTALVILSTGVWKAPAEGRYEVAPAVVPGAELGVWSLETLPAPPRDPRYQDGRWREGERVFAVLAMDNAQTGGTRHRLYGTVMADGTIEWESVKAGVPPALADAGVHGNYSGAKLTARAFDTVHPALGKWMLTMVVWLFALSTMISWSYYGEQGLAFMGLSGWLLGYRILFCALALVATSGLISTSEHLDALTGIGTGFMLWVNIPIMLLFGGEAMRAYHAYKARLDSGEMKRSTTAPRLRDVFSGRDVE